jgi:hypothetical protein
VARACLKIPGLLPKQEREYSGICCSTGRERSDRTTGYSDNTPKACSLSTRYSIARKCSDQSTITGPYLNSAGGEKERGEEDREHFLFWHLGHSPERGTLKTKAVPERSPLGNLRQSNWPINRLHGHAPFLLRNSKLIRYPISGSFWL